MTVDFEDVSCVSFQNIVKNIVLDGAIAQNRPLPYYQIDPRGGERVVYSEARAKRPHDTAPLERPRGQKGCVVCEGKTTSTIDIAPLTEGFTFINKNLFPVVYPYGEGSLTEGGEGDLVPKTGYKAVGTHFLQWTSNQHDRDFDNMKPEDIFVVLRRLALFEERLLHSPESGMPISHRLQDGDHYGYIGVIKNVGRLVGGSLVHGHHQIVHTNIEPRRIEEDQGFRERGRCFSEYILQSNPQEYTVKEYQGVVLLVPYFMRRPLQAMIVVRDSSKGYLHHLNKEELYSLGLALRDISAAVVALMPRLGRELAYNWIMHEGDIGGMYIELLPWTQEMGGYEQLGIYLCQGRPATTVEYYKELIS